ncbi:myosin-M heavy chain [Agrilus planipennis]|uniref:Myosin-M heavy chain n=1 Tax=Agrilus planipennis TaxID=224129 RepID=A0A1W4X106_AGRPL|nr:myosin-M heavy chain [Agrilus planipennis]XP_018326078.1 myosin-M heavy chain [Agrilus planipennis]
MFVCESYFFAIFIIKEVEEVMSLKQGQETHHSYMDGIRVKISENYKPPPRINPVTAYTQRILNKKHIQDNLSTYDFTLETNIKEKVKELKIARQQIRKEKKIRYENAKEERQRRLEQTEQEKKRLESEEKEIFIGANNSSVSSKFHENVSKILPYNTSNSVNTFNDISHNNFPTITTRPTYSHILTPIPLKEPICSTVTSKLNDKSPLNISDFEADNSSPFDNVELKTINDLEELAQVLKNDESINRLNVNPYIQMPQYGHYTPVNTVSSIPEPSTSYSMPNYNISSHPSFVTSESSQMAYQQKLPYSTANGFYYQPLTLEYDYNKVSSYEIPQATSYTYSKTGTSITDSKQSNTSVSASYKSVPDIMKALQDELSNVRMSNTNINRISCPESVTRNVQTTELSRKQKNTEEEEEKDEVFLSLPANLKAFSHNISSMGFPLSRVAKVVVAVGEDQKKVIEHLLAMSELLDLGFPESEVSKALLKSDNDRDKALDILIS